MSMDTLVLRQVAVLQPNLQNLYAGTINLPPLIKNQTLVLIFKQAWGTVFAQTSIPSMIVLTTNPAPTTPVTIVQSNNPTNITATMLLKPTYMASGFGTGTQDLGQIYHSTGVSEISMEYPLQINGVTLQLFQSFGGTTVLSALGSAFNIFLSYQIYIRTVIPNPAPLPMPVPSPTPTPEPNEPTVNVDFQQIHPDARKPRQTDDGYIFLAPQKVVIEPGETKFVSTGWQVGDSEMPNLQFDWSAWGKGIVQFFLNPTKSIVKLAITPVFAGITKMDPTIGIWLKNDGIQTKIIDLGTDLVNFVILRGFQSKIVKFTKSQKREMLTGNCEEDKKTHKTKKIQKKRL